MKKTAKSKFIVVTNREPYSFKKGKAEKAVGGLVSALDPIMQELKGTWVAFSGSTEIKEPGASRLSVPIEKPSYTLRRIFLSPKDVEGYYNGYSNRFLWPLSHITLDRVYLKRSYWESYKKVNSIFARVILEETKGSDSVIWLHDYHLALAASYIRQARQELKVSLFWHIPWPSYDVFRICPQRKEVLEGLLANDLLGFQMDSFKVNFMRCVESELNAGIDYKEGFIHYKGHATKIKAFPISIDYDWFQKAASSKKSERFFKKFRKELGIDGARIGLGVERLEYTKGLIKRLDALDLFFNKYPRFRGKFTFIQIAVPTRKVEPYISYMERVKKRVASLNRKYACNKWKPVEFIEDKLNHEELASLYRHADLAIISSVYDGMNLVAKEYAACQTDCKGALLISEFAGAADDIPGAMLINPYDIEGCADTIKKALTAGCGEKAAALSLAREHIRENNIYRWIWNILEELRSYQRARY